jgi:hypothetical protein
MVQGGKGLGVAGLVPGYEFGILYRSLAHSLSPPPLYHAKRGKGFIIGKIFFVPSRFSLFRLLWFLYAGRGAVDLSLTKSSFPAIFSLHMAESFVKYKM